MTRAPLGLFTLRRRSGLVLATRLSSLYVHTAAQRFIGLRLTTDAFFRSDPCTLYMHSVNHYPLPGTLTCGIWALTADTSGI
ncbi:unnamed protein product [Tilletia laevis]|uniref:Secreted protein n=3 Tax=Tilletia TaxID=13289 RepID=A0A8X7MI28_9BASI|nr:hypothetical protein CF328_g9642 [Tilletia controversa]KAE8179728.1 hypothetical protein CF336_g9539 [Tilletia laevis]KAE8236231.1 hypothetical protein A4X03_0g9509 [Tilletia caries]KAE8185173.1 hypothetical protein CF335_g7799 [Tilletia laevis]KAE8235876.1 hypothetical protein A4X06_0g9731 [Tilletia controversa]